MLPAEYVTEISGQTDAPEVRCELTDTQTQTATVTLLRMHGGLIIGVARVPRMKQLTCTW